MKRSLFAVVTSALFVTYGFATDVAGPYQSKRRSMAGHFMIAINIETLQPIELFNQRVEELIARMKGAPLAEGFDEIFYPGEIEARNEVANRKDGLLLPADTLRDLSKLASEFGLSDLLPF
jgi:LDH2 family malate/lactate/ureidoglycolate dehydrogenase